MSNIITFRTCLNEMKKKKKQLKDRKEDICYDFIWINKVYVYKDDYI